MKAKKKTKKSKEKLRHQWAINLLKKIIKGDFSDEETGPAVWLGAVAEQRNVSPSYIWYINKEQIINTYQNQYYAIPLKNGEWIKRSIHIKPKCTHEEDKPHSIQFIFPNGKTITPIRQFCDMRILPPGKRDAFFYDFGQVNLSQIQDGMTTDFTAPKITAKHVETNPKGSQISIGYNDMVVTAPTTIINATNTAFGLEALNDETKTVLDTTVDHIKTVGGEDELLTIENVIKARRLIEEYGLDVSNAVLYTRGKGIINLINDPKIKEYLPDKGKPVVITIPLLERILGVKLIRSSNIPEKTYLHFIPVHEGYWQRFKRVLLCREQPEKEVTKEITHSVLFIPNLTFGLVVSEKVTMEAYRRNEMQAVHITGTNRIAAVLKNPQAAVGILHL